MPSAAWTTSVLDAAGIVYRSTDTQACTTSRVRRRAGRYGYRIEVPDNVWIAASCTTTAPRAPASRRQAIAGSDGIALVTGHFHACKAWYCHGFGWHVANGRNIVGCEPGCRQARLVHHAPAAPSPAAWPTLRHGRRRGRPRVCGWVLRRAFQRDPPRRCMVRPFTGRAVEQQRFGFNVPRRSSTTLLVAPSAGRLRYLVNPVLRQRNVQTR